jgi:hypothetical protein
MVVHHSTLTLIKRAIQPEPGRHGIGDISLECLDAARAALYANEEATALMENLDIELLLGYVHWLVVPVFCQGQVCVLT